MCAVYKRTLAQSLLWYASVICTGAVLYILSVMHVKTLLILAIIVVGGRPLVRTVLIQGSDAFSPTYLLPLTYTLYALGPLMASMEYEDNVIIYYLLLQLLGLLAMRCGLHTAIKQKSDRSVYAAIESLRGSSGTLFVLTFMILLFLSSVSLVTIFNAFGGLIGYIETGYGGDFFLILREAKVFGAGIEWWLLGAAMVLFYGIKQRRRLLLLLGVVLFGLMAGIVLMTGRRSQLLFSILFGFVLFHYGYRRLPTSLVIAGILLGIIAAQYFALARFFLSEGLIYALSQVWPSVKANPYLLAPWASNEFRMPAASLLELLEYGGPGLLLGRSYIAALGGPFPLVARLIGQVSFDVNVWRLTTFYPSIYEAGGGLGFSPVAEAYLNFGVIGVFFHMFLFGYTIGRMYNRLRKKPTWSSLLLFAGSLPVFMLDGMRLTSASFAWKWIRIYLMPWIIFVVLKKLISERSRTLPKSESTWKK
nr:MAG: hypothetical protein KatS3mg041_2036 [Bacteroidota bacterium]